MGQRYLVGGYLMGVGVPAGSGGHLGVGDLVGDEGVPCGERRRTLPGLGTPGGGRGTHHIEWL